MKLEKRVIGSLVASFIAAVLLFCAQSLTVLAASSIPFQVTTIDTQNSGDDKAVADIDLDGDMDGILGGSVAGRSLVWYESGASYAMHVIRANPIYAEFTTDMQAEDVDGDGDFDIIVGDNNGPNNVMWFENPVKNHPAGTTSDPKVGSNWLSHTIGSHQSWAHDIETGDFNGDGRLDIITSGNGYTHLWIQNTPLEWTDVNLSSLAGQGVSPGDIDRDGNLDIATPSGWLRNPGDPVSGNWVRYPITNTSGDEVAVGDLNNDGRLDIMTIDAHNRAAFAWFEAPATPTSSNWTRRVIDASMGAHHPEVGDFNNDGWLDILAGLELQDLSIYLNNGGSPPTFTKQQIDTVAAHNARLGDLNGDGLLDIFGADYIGNPPVKVYINQGNFGAAQLDASVQLQGRPTPPNLAWAIPVHVRLTPTGSTTPVVDHVLTTNSQGKFLLKGLATGSYRIWLKGTHTLAVEQTINLTTGSNSVSLGPLPEGDSNEDNSITIGDFARLAAAFGTDSSTAGFDFHADFDVDGAVSILDFSLLALNFGMVGA